MVYKVIGLMSGSSLDGLDIAYVHLNEVGGQWNYEVIHAECVPYSANLAEQLRNASQKSVHEYLRLNTSYGRFLGEAVNGFIERNGIEHQVHLVASHGHTVMHEPHNHTSTQIGDGATIAAVTGLPVVSDLRNMDVALGGQGAPIVPVGDKLLFGQYDYWLNIGGIANITVPHNGETLAFDVCAANQMLNGLAEMKGMHMDKDGAMARTGKLQMDILADLNDEPYYLQEPPKSLSNEQAKQLVFPILLESKNEVNDLLRTAVQHIADKITEAVKKHPSGKERSVLLATGGGALNGFLMERIREGLAALNTDLHIPDEQTVNYKEAIVMALIGTLRFREETNVLSSITGASRDSIGGALWMGHSYS
ncbi:MAG: anhydro-N-acetylmuramic acid kinase [Chitinophagaceae bacterium]|nr:anhydro-N-acetylmuramic acid kinase [Chitinophagaceae bacterium]MCB9045900.1 anhydro-N-acetylmuramic acid kinase [Chitinophagales bacterium]